ncbi:hypothetical protein BX661DRAFT_201780 [Kickxella alabastrina]|uniref:uncharacterized protein n=1 Tax=Kickxella alabastrina TaxID=61397 RepID=UPI002220AC34|nr:uncharacterized protein BX661DRAFT_201780 [Kickxella alabastrina]KAI7818755.1 hypothetical protein BX661DRAFT_201780 [Kickxella alabastrina]
MVNNHQAPQNQYYNGGQQYPPQQFNDQNQQQPRPTPRNSGAEEPVVALPVCVLVSAAPNYAAK